MYWVRTGARVGARLFRSGQSRPSQVMESSVSTLFFFLFSFFLFLFFGAVRDILIYRERYIIYYNFK